MNRRWSHRKETIIIGGSIAQKPWYGGHTWVFLQYVLGFRKLGWNVLFLDHLQPDMCIDENGQPCTLEESANLDYFVRVMKEFELDGSHALLYGDGNRVIGMSRATLREEVAHAAVMFNVMGFIRDDDVLGRTRNRVFLDIDPGFGQMWQDLGLCTMFSGHDSYVTIGENVGHDGCSVPTCGVNWINTRPPVQLDYWKPNGETAHRSFTTIATWRGQFGPIEFHGKTYGLRVHEFRKVAVLPKSTGERFEIALDIHPADSVDKMLLENNGWILVDPRAASRDPRRYRAFIQNSGAEFMVAKNLYVETRSGWFSDRSSCYLASGKPVLAQDTGLKALYPTGKGLLLFRTLDEAISGVREISGNYAAHARAAGDIAAEFFDSNKVLGSLLDKVA
jgi:hypothetical protein